MTSASAWHVIGGSPQAYALHLGLDQYTQLTCSDDCLCCTIQITKRSTELQTSTTLKSSNTS